LLELHLKPFDAEDDVVGGGDEVVLGVAVHEQYAGAVHRDDLDDVVDEVIEDRLDGEVAGQRPGELDQDGSQPLLVHGPPHNSSPNRVAEGLERVSFRPPLYAGRRGDALRR